MGWEIWIGGGWREKENDLIVVGLQILEKLKRCRGMEINVLLSPTEYQVTLKGD